MGLILRFLCAVVSMLLFSPKNRNKTPFRLSQPNVIQDIDLYLAFKRQKGRQK